MPTIHREAGYRFFFYSNEGKPREPPHVHVERADGDAKFWIGEDPPRLADSNGFSARELLAISGIVGRERARMEVRWYEHFSDGRPL